MKSRESRRAYLKKVREEREKAESLAIQFLLLCEQRIHGLLFTQRVGTRD